MFFSKEKRCEPREMGAPLPQRPPVVSVLEKGCEQTKNERCSKHEILSKRELRCKNYRRACLPVW